MTKITKLLSLSVLAVSLSACTTDFTSSTSSTVDAVTPDITINEFVSKRYLAIRNEAAKGGGENIDALAQLMGKKDSHEFSRQMKTNFDIIFSDVKTPVDIIAKIEAHNSFNNG